MASKLMQLCVAFLIGSAFVNIVIHVKKEKAHNQTITLLKTKIQEQDESIAVLESTIDLKDQLHTTEISAILRDLLNQRRSISAQDDTIAAMQSAIDADDQTIAMLQSQIRLQRQSMSFQSETIAALQSTCATSERTIATLDSQLNTERHLNENQKEQINKLERELEYWSKF